MKIADVARRISPRHRRWQRLLRTRTLRPEDVLPGRDELAAHEFLVCGCPRSGTSLAAAQLFQPPGLVTVMEPWDGLAMRPPDLFRSLRSELSTGVLRRGRLDVSALVRDREVAWTRETVLGHEGVPVEVDEDHLLGVKWPTYWQLVPRLRATKMIVCLRHPLEVVASFGRQTGRLSQGLLYDVAFNERANDALLAATSDPVCRRAHLYAFVNEQLLPHLDSPNVYALRYERWVEDPAELLRELGAFLDTDLSAPPPAAIKRPPRTVRVTRAEMSAIAEHCSEVAGKLGYDLPGRALVLAPET